MSDLRDALVALADEPGDVGRIVRQIREDRRLEGMRLTAEFLDWEYRHRIPRADRAALDALLARLRG